jgi:hypothetical protein
MGMFNERCMVTGIRLHEVTVVLLTEQDDGSFQACTLPVEGRWDYYGGIEELVNDAHCAHLVAALRDAIRNKSLRVDFDACDRDPVGPSDDGPTLYSKLVNALGSDAFDKGRNAVLGRRLVRAAMIAREVADALTASTRAKGLQLQDLIAWKKQGELFYSRCSRARLADGVRRLSALQQALRSRRIQWSPTGPTYTQFSGDEARQAIHEGAVRYAGDRPIQRALLKNARYYHDEKLKLSDIVHTDWLTWKW